MDIVNELFERPCSIASNVLLHGIHSPYNTYAEYFKENPIEARKVAHSVGVPLGNAVISNSFAKIREMKPEIVKRFTSKFNLP
jgi:hypothetical protein